MTMTALATLAGVSVSRVSRLIAQQEVEPGEAGRSFEAGYRRLPGA
jgi:DNA-binding LacI/PurR family transcriptional regulator